MKNFFEVSEIPKKEIIEDSTFRVGQLVKYYDKITTIIGFHKHLIQLKDTAFMVDENEIYLLTEKEYKEYFETKFKELNKIMKDNNLISLDSDKFVCRLPETVILKK